MQRVVAVCAQLADVTMTPGGLVALALFDYRLAVEYVVSWRIAR